MAENKWQLILHEQVEDPYYEITNGPISLVATCGFVGETEEEEDALFKRVTDTLNESGIEFHSENKLELQQHNEIEKLKFDLELLKSRPILPADDAVQNWFEDNINKECSASSAIYKFRLWLRQLNEQKNEP